MTCKLNLATYSLLLGACLLMQDNLCVAAPVSAMQSGPDFTTVAEKDIPAVVSIQVKGEKLRSSLFGGDDSDLSSDDFFQHFFSIPGAKTPPKQTIEGQGSGFIVSPDGYILTNSHVVSDATEIKVVLNNDGEYKAKLIGFDPNTDIAVVKIDGKDLPYLKLGNSDDLKVGQWVAAIGNPLGLQASLTVGIVSAKSRNNLDLANVEDFIQTDAAINRGNSGGPLLNMSGEVIGINTAIVTNNGSGGYMGIGFAIPSNIARHVMDQLIKSGSVTRGFIGVFLQAVDNDLAHAFGLKHPEGALVSDVAKNSPAEKAGLKQGDIVQAYNKQPISNIGALRNLIALMTPGSKVSLTVIRNGNTMEIPVEIGAYPNTTLAKGAVTVENKLGFEVQDLTPEIAHALGIKEDKGVVISKIDPNSIAAAAGLKKGALITAVNKKPVTSIEEFNAALKESPADKPVLLLIRQGDVIRFLSLKVG